MKKLTLAMVLVLSVSANAETLSMKAGLWETKIIHQIMDGKDMAPEIAAAQAKMQAAMANMTPEQRAQMAPMLKNMQGSNGVMRMCVSPAMAAKQAAMIEPGGNCNVSSITTSGSKTDFSYSCSHNGRSSSGTGERIENGNMVSTHLNITTNDSKGQHKMIMDIDMKYFGADCQGVVPFDDMIK